MNRPIELSSYTKYQIEEIENGKKAGIDIALYSNPEFMPVQMRQIRLGLEKGLAVEIYAKTGYDWFQMEEIRKGLEAGIAVDIYASPDIPFEKMRQLRKGLMQGVDLSDYLKYDAGIIHQLRRASATNVDLMKYIEEGYDEEQLAQIRIGLENGVKLDSYITPEFVGVSIQQIRRGLEAGLDVSCYARVDLNWRQMREIRIGMENRVDYELYSHPYYTWRQMREVREGLEQDLDVSSYNNLMYPASVMEQKRKKMLSYRYAGERENFKEEVKTEHFKLTVSENGMEAYLTILAEDVVIGKSEIIEILLENGVVKGIAESILEEIEDGKHEGQTVLIAKGKVPKMGKDGWYEYFFRTNLAKKPKILPDGTADYKNVEWFESVKKGDKIVFYHTAEPGEDGFTVTGVVLPGKRGRDQKMLTGKGFILKDDKRTYVADVDGMITVNDGKLLILEELELEDVSIATGSLSFDGSIHIKGQVGSGTLIKATGDIIIDGFVGAAMIESLGRVVMKRGVNADEKGYIKAKKGVVSSFFENVEVYSEEDIQTNYCLNSNVSTEGHIYIQDTLVGGKIYAEKGIVCKHAGTPSGTRTELIQGKNQTLEKQRSEMEKEIQETESELTSLKQSMKELQQKYPPEVRNRMDIFLKVETAIYTLGKQLMELYEAKRKIDYDISKNDHSKIEIQGMAYEGVIVNLGGRIWKADNQHNITLRRAGDQIHVLNN